MFSLLSLLTSVAANQKVLVDGFGAGRGIGEVSCVNSIKMDSWKLKAMSMYAQSKAKFGGDEEGAIAPFVRMYMFGACAIVALLGLIALIVQEWLQGVWSILIAILIASIEATFFVKQIEKHLEFFLENYVFRACAYAVLAIPALLSLVTLLGALLLFCGAGAYAFCWFRGEKPKIGPQDGDAPRNEENPEQSQDLLSNYQPV